jgi:serine protease AprX
VTSDGIVYLTGSTGIKNSTATDNSFTVYPNPFSGTTTISYTRITNEPLRIILVDLLGKQIELVNTNYQSAGTHQLTIDSETLGLSGGMYFLEMISGDRVQTLKLSVK